ncbi:helix-turn-helix domain-containing protein [Psychroserpens sp. AS72]|uniref:helix-turn-helix domain-containing protein n=1 Tax=Psychroserpens sp. AS72 TaxID=3135775 RepID=UPI003173CC9A
MTKVILNSIELSDIRKEVEDIFAENLEHFIKPEKKENILMSRKDTAKYLCISLPTLHDWTKKGVVKAHRIGNRVLYKLNDIHSALNEVNVSKMRGGLSC